MLATGRRQLGAVALLALSISLTGCARDALHKTPGTAISGRSVPYQLYTHCGIDEALVDGTYFEAAHPLDDGNGNPPTGWGNPYQDGTMTLTSPTTAIFRDRHGHSVEFRARIGATGFKHLCS
jgi:hypothetical protein